MVPATLRDGFFFESGAARLYGYFHPALGDARRVACVLVQPFMEERKDAHASLRELACSLAARRVPALRFDLYGTGDSEGDWSDATLAAWLDNIHDAVALVRAEAGASEVVLAGLRFGATLAALAAPHAGVERVALVQPVVRGEEYVREMLLAHLTAEMVLHRKVGTTRETLLAELDAGRSVNLFGYHLTPAQAAAIRAVDLSRALAESTLRALVVEVCRTETARQSPDVKAVVAALGPRGHHLRVVEPWSLVAEGKVQVTRAENVNRAIAGWLEE